MLEVRPSPWRQAVDLANMMLVMALRTRRRPVYERALAYFTPDEIAEAFAWPSGWRSRPSSRPYLKEDPRDLIGRFKELAPPHAPISIQRWSMRRIGFAAGAVVGLVLVAALAIDTFSAGVP